MSKGLEKLQIIRHIYHSEYGEDVSMDKDLDIIEKELKEYESHKTFIDNAKNGLIVFVPRDTWEEERKKLKRLEELERAFVSLSKDDEKAKKLLSLEIEKNRALEIIKVLFQGRARLYERNDGIEQTIDKNGNYHKCNCVVYILEFYSGRIHYEFHLHKDEFDLLKEVFYDIRND